MSEKILNLVRILETLEEKQNIQHFSKTDNQYKLEYI